MGLNKISDTRNYWLVRTKSGLYYDDFYRNGYIAVNFDEITEQDLNELSEDELYFQFKKLYPNSVQVRRYISQLRTFHKVIKKDDLVLITSHASNRIAVGRVSDTDIFSQHYSAEALSELPKNVCPFVKRKRVDWLKTFDKWDLDKPVLKCIQHNQLVISNVNEIGSSIESTLSEFYIIGDIATLVLNINKDDNIPFAAYSDFQNSLLSILRKYERMFEYKLQIDDLYFKTNLNSKGNVKISGENTTLKILAYLLGGILLIGGGGSLILPQTDLEFDLKSIGLMMNINEMLNDAQTREEREIIMSKFQELEINNPDEFVEIYKTINKTEYWFVSK